MKTCLTGIKPTGKVHLGNYIGAIKPALTLSHSSNIKSIFFIADYHSLTTIRDHSTINQLTHEVAATWLALGLDPNEVIFFRQSDIPELFELNWILSCLTPKGLMNRSHAYKALCDKNFTSGKTTDTGINMGLFSYPILMASDILMFNANIIPIGKDQIQHLEITRDIAHSFNKNYGTTFTIPEYLIQKDLNVIPGLDGRKMSKSYNNTIPIFEKTNKLKKLINKIKTNSLPPHASKDITNCTLFSLYKSFASENEIEEMKIKYAKGIGWGDVKKNLFEVIERELKVPREKYTNLINSPDYINQILKKGALHARTYTKPFLKELKKTIGI